MSALVGSSWNKLCCLMIFIVISGRQSLDISTKVVISNWTLPEDKMGISCSISMPTDSAKELYKIHLICPLFDGISCYANCNSQCIQESGCSSDTLRKAIYSCNYVKVGENRIDLQYQINVKYIKTGGQWMCQYGGQKSAAIYIDKYYQPTVESSRLTERFTEPFTTQLTTTQMTPLFISEAKIIIIIVISLGVSVMVNLILIAMVFVMRKKFYKTDRKIKRKQIAKDVTETTSMLKKSSDRLMLNRSNCSRTPSLDSPSFRESITTYLPECPTILSTNPTTRDSHQYCVDQYGRIIRLVHPISPFPVDSTDILSHHSSGESSSAYLTNLHGNVLLPQRISINGSHVINWSQVVPQHQDSFSSARVGGSHQQIYVDSNDESGIGSQSLSNSAKQKHESFHGGSDRVDLILDCDPNLNNMSRPKFNEETR